MNTTKKQRSVYSFLMFVMARPRSLRSTGLNLSNCFQYRVCVRYLAPLWCASLCFQVSERAFLFEQMGEGSLCGGFCWCGITVVPAEPHPGRAGFKGDSPAAAWSRLIVEANFTLSQHTETEPVVQESEENTNTFLKLFSSPSTSCVNWVSHFFVRQRPTTPTDMFKPFDCHFDFLQRMILA